MGNTISKAASTRNHATSAIRDNRISAIFAPLIAPRFFKKTIASAERADKRPLPTYHNATLRQKCKLEDALVMILML